MKNEHKTSFFLFLFFFRFFAGMVFHTRSRRILHPERKKQPLKKLKTLAMTIVTDTIANLKNEIAAKQEELAYYEAMEYLLSLREVELPICIYLQDHYKAETFKPFADTNFFKWSTPHAVWAFTLDAGAARSKSGNTKVSDFSWYRKGMAAAKTCDNYEKKQSELRGY